MIALIAFVITAPGTVKKRKIVAVAIAAAIAVVIAAAKAALVATRVAAGGAS